MQAIYDNVEGREERYELNLYIAGEDEDGAAVAPATPSESRKPPPAGTGRASDRRAPAEPARCEARSR